MKLMDLPKKKDHKVWKICIDQPFMNCNKIYPIQQKKVASIISSVKNNPNVKRITIFGSSVTDRCHIDSDVDVYIELEKLEHLVFYVNDFVYDLWTNFTVDERMIQEIKKKGVVVYERDAAR